MRSEKSPTDIAKSVELDTGMDDHGSQGTPRPLPPAARRSTKGKAPPPPAAKGLDGQRLSLRLLGSPLSTMDQKENLIDKDLNLTVVLPGGVETPATVPGSKPMMDLLVMLCAKYHLNPSGHTIELISTNRNHIKFKPNALIGTLEAERILLKPKGVDEKSKKAGPQMPEATVRLVINYKKTQKTILRVNPRVPLEDLMPAVCEKCEFDQKTSVLLRDVLSEEPLDLTKSLNDFGLREVYAVDTKSVNSDIPSSPIERGDRSPSYKSRSFKEKENKGLFSLFRRSSKKKPDQAVAMSAPTSPVLSKPRPVSMPLLGASASVYSSSATLSDVPKKRRAPLPPTMVSPRSPSSLSDSPTYTFSEGDREVSGIRRGSSSESSLKRTKRKAPPPPSSPSAMAKPDEALEDGSVKAGSVPHSPLEEIREQEEMAVTATPDPGAAADVRTGDGSPDASADVPMDSGKTEPELPPPPTDEELAVASSPLALDGTGEDQSNDLSSDGKPAKDPASDQECTEQTPNTVETPELEHRDSAGTDTAGTDLSPPAEAEQTVLLVEGASVLGDVKEKSDSGTCTAPSAPEFPAPPPVLPAPPAPRPQTRDAETLTSDEPNGGAPLERAEIAEAPAAVAAVSPAASPPIAASPTPPVVQLPPASPSEAARPKRDMATSTEELPQGEAPPTSPQEPKSSPIYLLDYAPKPKPSNELTREYIPKVGLTTYTIVPQKSLEKLRFFEVELTLEPPGSAPGQMVAVGTQRCLAGVPAEQLELRSPTLVMGAPLSNGRFAGVHGFHGNSPPAQSPPAQSPAAQSPPAPADAKPPSLRRMGTWAAPGPKKTPPPTKPKPGSFRLSLHKRTPGYVTSAAVKSANAILASGRTEAPGRPDAGQPAEEESFPPPPPPELWAGGAETSQDEPKPREENTVDGPAANLASPAPRPIDSAPNVNVPGPAPGPVDSAPNVNVPAPGPVDSAPDVNVLAPAPMPVVPATNVNVLAPAPRPVDLVPNATVSPPRASGSAPRLTRQYSLPASDPTVGLSLERMRGLMAPKPYAPTSQSRFARAVSTAIKRSQSFTKPSSADPQPPGVLPASSLANQNSIKEVAEPSRSPEKEVREREEGKTPEPQPGERPDGGTGGAVSSEMPVGGETNSPAVPDALPQLSLNGGPTEM
ncbi:cordon-bleu protein-like 1b isoform X3 [Anguilla rostrata]|uniref:cordon-bleu protein-like 1b isoform X3 n=1 Tax=Anguilla rostrata TaxID=7938 RepID=UPI0030CD8E59